MTGGELTVSDAVEVLKEMVSGGAAGLDGGAEVEVFDEAGKSVFLAALARHVRLDEDGIIWIRPIVGGFRPEARGEPAYAFDLSVARRRALDVVEIRREGNELVLQLVSGDEAHIRSVSWRTEPDLERWDRFFYNAPDAREQVDLDSLAADV